MIHSIPYSLRKTKEINKDLMDFSEVSSLHEYESIIAKLYNQFYFNIRQFYKLQA